MRIKNTNDFIKVATSLHENKYDYSKVEYINSHAKVEIICKIHGSFQQRPCDHIHSKTGCPLCAKEKALTGLSDFIDRSKQIHGDRYDYSKVVYKNSYTRVEIICPDHGSFIQTPHNHLNGHICRKCSSDSHKLNTLSFVKKAREVHGDLYEYDNSLYTHSQKKLSITCKVHGEFVQNAANHLMGQGCPECFRKNVSFCTAVDFINAADEVHGDKYDYSGVVFLNMREKVKIVCKKHGEFNQSAYDHVHMQTGCPVCKSSKGEQTIINWLKLNEIYYIHQYRVREKDRFAVFDFYIPSQTTVIEYDGPQHDSFQPYFHKNEEGFQKQKLRDLMKSKWAACNNIKLLRISHADNVDELLEGNLLCR